MSDLPPPPAPSGGWPQPGAPGQPQWTPPPSPGPWGAPEYYTAQQYGPPRAGFWIRFAGAFIDGLIFAPLAIIGRLILSEGPTRITDCPNGSGFRPGELCEVPTGGTWAAWALFELATVVLAVIYYSQLDGKRGATWGKRAVGLRVVDINTGQPIGVGRGVGRYFARILSAIPCFLGFFWMLWDPQKQTWHDKLVSSVVIKA